MRTKTSRLVCLFLFPCLIRFVGCGDDQTPEGPERSALEKYVEENPEAMNRIDEGVEPDDEDESGE